MVKVRSAVPAAHRAKGKGCSTLSLLILWSLGFCESVSAQKHLPTLKTKPTDFPGACPEQQPLMHDFRWFYLAAGQGWRCGSAE